MGSPPRASSIARWPKLVVYTGATEILLLIAPTGRNPLRVPREASVLPTHDKITPVVFFYNGTYGLHEV